MMRETSSRVSGATSPRPLSTRETVAIDTPASSATSRIVTRECASSAMASLKHVPEHLRNIGALIRLPGLDFGQATVVTVPETFTGRRAHPRSNRPTPGEKGPQMRRSFRSTRRLAAVGVVAGLAVLALDVVYSLTAGHQNAVMDRIGLTGTGNNVQSIRAHGPNTVAITLKTPDSQFVAAILNRQFVIPQHIWSKVSDPATFTNSNPVGSGPYDKISRFTTQDYVFSKNPSYWQAGLPKVPCLEYVQAASNDSALALIQSGQVDWTHNFVPNVAKAYTAKDPKHFHAFYATAAYPISLHFDDTQYPFSLFAFRKALSQAIDRSTVSKLGEYGYAPPTDALGLSFLFPRWVTDPAVKAQAKALATYSPAAAKKTL